MKIKCLALLILLVSAFNGFGQFFFSEFSFSNTSGTVKDNLATGQYNESPDWVEIYYNQTSPTQLQISGWYLSDDRNNLVKWQIPTAISGGQPFKLDTHNVMVIYLCGHDRCVSNGTGVNAGNIQYDLHANFTCDQTKPGSKVYLSNINGVVKDSIEIYKYKTKPGHSRGREVVQGPTCPPATPMPPCALPLAHWNFKKSPWRLYQTPSPGSVNTYTTTVNQTAWYVDYCPTPVVDQQPGFYAALPTLNVKDTNTAFINNLLYPNMTIYATNDCTPPIFSNGNAQNVATGSNQGTPLSGPFTVSNTANQPVSMVRIMMTDAGSPQRYLDSWEFYGAYMLDTLDYKMDITCVCVDTSQLFGLVAQKDSMPMIIHQFDDNRTELFKNQGQGLIRGIDFFNPVGYPATNPAMTKKQWQFVYRSEDEYGYNYTNTAQLFDDATTGNSLRTNFPNILYRSAAEENFLFPGLTSTNSGFQGAHVRDFYNHTISLRHNLRFEASHYRPTYMVINGTQRGIYYIKESFDSLYAATYFNRPKSLIVGNSPIFGTQYNISGLSVPDAKTQWNWFYNWAMTPSTNVHIPALYYRISDSLDFNSFNDYMVYNFLSINTDFVKSHAMWWKGLPNDTGDHRIEDSKWRFALSNTDNTWGFDVNNSVGVGNTGPNSEPCDYLQANSPPFSWPPTGATVAGNAAYPLIPLWYKLMDNDTFKSEFVTRYSDLMNSALSCDSLQDHFKYIRTLLPNTGSYHAMQSHVWWNLADPNGPCATCDSVHYWNGLLDSMNIFLAQRCSLVNTSLSNCFQIGGPYNLCIDVDPVNSGYVQFNSLTLKNFVWNGKYFDSIINVIKGIPYQNYVFDHWEGNTYNFSPSRTSDSATFYIPADGCIKAIFKLRPAYETTGTPMLPTGFSPNGDGNNDILNIYGIVDASSYEMEVYNRWGEQIFHSVDKTEGWDGKYNGTDVPAGVYAYRYNIIINGKTYKKNGNVTLVR